MSRSKKIHQVEILEQFLTKQAALRKLSKGVKNVPLTTY